MDKIICPSCGTENPIGTQFCINADCGEPLPEGNLVVAVPDDQSTPAVAATPPPPTLATMAAPIPSGPSVNLTLVRIGKVHLGEGDAANLPPKIWTFNFDADHREATIGGTDEVGDLNYMPDVDLVYYVAWYGAFISRRQAKIVWDEVSNTVSIVHESTSNQSMVIPVDASGKPIKDEVVTCELDPVELKDGVNLLLGNCRFTFHVNSTIIASPI